jgi:hypothetical protein
MPKSTAIASASSEDSFRSARSSLRRSPIRLAIGIPSPRAAASNESRVGTWSGMLNNKEPVSVTIFSGKVVAYNIRGGEPFPIGFNGDTVNTVSFGDNTHYSVSIHRTCGKSALGRAHDQIGDGSRVAHVAVVTPSVPVHPYLVVALPIHIIRRSAHVVVAEGDALASDVLYVWRTGRGYEADVH